MSMAMPSSAVKKGKEHARKKGKWPVDGWASGVVREKGRVWVLG